MLRVPGPGVPALAAESDIVFVLARRAGAATTGLVDEGFLRSMKKPAVQTTVSAGKRQPYTVLVNTSRGTLVDSHARARALRERWIWGVGVNVVTGEPQISADHPLVRERSSISYRKCAGGDPDRYGYASGQESTRCDFWHGNARFIGFDPDLTS
ncbi:hypothetical protein BJ912DRAFT_1044928 [Pholiota molesta]|nr:hypothetical protein BJ912DRAFT_1044928 [Pholiota molesta]